jgi:tetratricopeptide (TPR) repeat protein
MRAPPAADGTRRRRIAAVVSLACALVSVASPARALARDAQVTAAGGAPQAATAAPAPAPSPAAAIVPPPGVSAARVAPVRRPPIPLAAAVREVSPPARIAPPPIPAPLAGSATESEALRRYVRGKQRLLDGQLNRAIDDIDAALRLDPGAPELRAARAEIAGAAGDPARARADWEAVLALDPGNMQALVSLGIDAFEAGQAQRAAALLGRAWPDLSADGFAAISDAGRIAIGGALARSLFRLGFDEAGVEVSMGALGNDPGPAPGRGIDAAARSEAQLALEAGEASLRCGRADVAFVMFARSITLVPDARTVALAAYAQLVGGDAAGARMTLSILMDDSPWREAERTVLAEWLLRALGGDGTARETLAIESISAVPMARGASAATPGVRARVARLLIAAGDAAAGGTELEAAVADGAVDPASLVAAFAHAGDDASPAAALAVVRAYPESLRDCCRALVRSSRDLRALRGGIEQLPPSALREALAAGVLATLRASGDAWRRAEAAVEADPSRAPLEAMLLAAVAAADPALVTRAAAEAPLQLDSEPQWHASLARAFAETGASVAAEESLARAELMSESSVPVGPALARSLAEAHALVDGRAPQGSARARAESALSRGDAVLAASELLFARALDPDDAATLGMLLGLLPRTDGPRAAAEWIDGEFRRTPNDPILWQVSVLSALGPLRSTECMARVESRLAADPDDTLCLPWRESLLRSAGKSAEAAAAARGRVASLPLGPRRSLEEAETEVQFGTPAAAIDALGRFQESVFAPPSSMRAAALDIARRVPATAPGRAELIRRIARDAIMANPAAPLEFYAFEALGAASDPGIDADAAADGVAMIASEAAGVAALREQSEPWRSSADFLLSQRLPRAAAEFLRARLEDPAGLSDADVTLLMRAAIACDAAVGGRAAASLALVGRLRGMGIDPFGGAARPAAEYQVVSGIYTMLGDDAGAEVVMEAGLAVDPSDPALLNNLGFTRLERGAIDARTEQLLEQAVRARAEDSESLDSLGWLRYAQGRLVDSDAGPGAVTLLERAVSKTRGAVSAAQRDHLGDARWRVGDHEGARREWTEAVRIAEAGMPREQNIEVLRRFFRQQLGLAAIDAARYHDAHDGSLAARAKAKLDASARGVEPPVARQSAVPAPNPPASAR